MSLIASWPRTPPERSKVKTFTELSLVPNRLPVSVLPVVLPVEHPDEPHEVVAVAVGQEQVRPVRELAPLDEQLRQEIAAGGLDR